MLHFNLSTVSAIVSAINAAAHGVLWAKHAKFKRSVAVEHINLHDKIDAKLPVKGYLATQCSVCGKLVIKFDPITKICSHCQYKASR